MLRTFTRRENEMVGKCVWSAFLGCSSPYRHVVVLCVTIQKPPSGSLPEHCELSVAIRPVSAGNAAQGWSAFYSWSL